MATLKDTGSLPEGGTLHTMALGMASVESTMCYTIDAQSIAEPTIQGQSESGMSSGITTQSETLHDPVTDGTNSTWSANPSENVECTSTIIKKNRCPKLSGAQRRKRAIKAALERGEVIQPRKKAVKKKPKTTFSSCISKSEGESPSKQEGNTQLKKSLNLNTISQPLFNSGNTNSQATLAGHSSGTGEFSTSSYAERYEEEYPMESYTQIKSSKNQDTISSPMDMLGHGSGTSEFSTSSYTKRYEEEYPMDSYTQIKRSKNQDTISCPMNMLGHGSGTSEFSNSSYTRRYEEEYPMESYTQIKRSKNQNTISFPTESDGLVSQVTTPVKMAVVLKSYPVNNLSDEMIKTLKLNLTKEIFKCNPGELPKFTNYYSDRGVLYITCADKISQEWLVQKISGDLNKCVGVPLKVGTSEEIMNTTKMSVWVPLELIELLGVKDPKRIISLVSTQNPTVSSKDIVIDHSSTDKFGTYIVLYVGHSALKALEDLKFKVHLGLSQIPFGKFEKKFKPKTSNFTKLRY